MKVMMVPQVTQTVLQQAIAANRALVFREWWAKQPTEIKSKLQDELSPMMSFSPAVPDGVSISEAFAVAGSLFIMGIVDGINREWYGHF